MSFVARAVLGAVVGLAGVLVPLAGAVTPVAAASPPKVVIVVGPVAGTTASYKSDADAAAAEALKYTPNVVKIYSPNATWAVVKPALQGASIVVYMGHGNGFPSPYTTTPAPDRQNGLGLNPTAGIDDSATKYWGEQFLAGEVRLAPGAVVILGHLCYASGSSEPGKADPTPTQAKQRVDNFAAGFLASGARAVIAEAYGGSAARYIGALFTAHDTVGNIWANASTQQGQTFSFPSTRTPGMTAQMDPDRSSGKYHRSIVGDLNLSSDTVIGGAAQNPTSTPTPTPTPVPTAPAPTPTPTPTPTPPPPSAIVGDDSNADLTSHGITLMSMSAPVAFSPNGDGRQDTFPIHAKLSWPATWQLTITDQYGVIYASTGGAGDTIDFNWDGTSSGARMPDGLYGYRLSASDGLGGSLDRTAKIRIDSTPPAFTPAGTTATPTAFSPNGDGVAEAWSGTFNVNEAVSIDATVVASDGTVVRHLAARSVAGKATVTWNAATDAGSPAPDGQYYVSLTALDSAGNTGTPVSVSVSVYRALSRVAASAAVFYPQDGDTYAPSTDLSFVLTQPATVTWSIVNASGRTVATKLLATALPPGAVAWTWLGVDDAGAPVAPGAYTAVLSVGNGTLATTSRTALTVAAFKIATSTTTASRGHSLTVTATTAEPLAARPRLTVSRPGIAAWSTPMTKVGTNTYRVTIVLSRTGSAGTLVLKVAGTDAGNGSNVATTKVPLR